VGGLANLLSGHRDLANAMHRAEVAALWGIQDVPSKPGKTAVEMFQAAADGEIKALWIACTNPAQSMPDQTTVRRALERAEFVVVQEAFATTATCAFADLLLPATTWGEKEGTVTNSERRISRVRAAVIAPGATENGPRHDWAIAVDFAKSLERAMGRTGPSLFPYDTPESIWIEHRESTRGRDLDITGLTYAMLDEAPQQWPYPQGSATGKARLYEDCIFPTADGRAKFAVTTYKPVAEQREARYPFSLNTGRLRDQWHGMSRTGTLGRLFGHVGEPALQMHPQDMVRRLLKEGDLVHVTSKRGSILVPVQASNEQAMSQVFLAMHWGEETISGLGSDGRKLAGVNSLTTPAFCPDSKQPEFKHAAVKVLKAELPWTFLAMAWLPSNQVLDARAKLQTLMDEFAFATCVPFVGTGAEGQSDRQGLLFRAASYEAVEPHVLDRIETILNLKDGAVLHYADLKRGQRRCMRVQRDGEDTFLQGFLLAGDTRAQAWISDLLQNEQPAQRYGRALLLAVSEPPVPVVSKGKVVCSCFNVRDVTIGENLMHSSGSDAVRLSQLQDSLHCGTNCGSCVPELQRMVRMAAVPNQLKQATVVA